jgi:3-hydroxybutyryl-CoA dehydrogenase
MAVTHQLKTVAVIGNGLMGHGITQIFAAGGCDVYMIGRNPDRLAEAVEKIRASLAQFVDEALLSRADVEAALARITTSTDLADAGRAELVVEAVTENIPLKHEIFEKLDQACPPETVLASSSGQPPSVLVDRVRHRHRVVAAHFWYPAQLIPLVEVCPGPETDPEVVTWTMSALRSVGCEPVVMDKEVPGLIGNRIQFAMLREAWALWASGAASAEAIDTVVRNTLGRRLGISGPIESADLGGLDTLHAFAESLLPHIDASPEPAAKVTELVRQGNRGAASGRGVYDWSARDPEVLRGARFRELFRWLRVDREARGQ